MCTLISHPARQVLFVLLSLADLALTHWLLDRPEGDVYEGNPIACWLLLHHGWLGLICFKVGMVFFVLGIAALISRSHPRAGGLPLTVGCAALALVVLYSAVLGATVAGSPEERYAELAQAVAIARRDQAVFQEGQAYRALLSELGEQLRAGRCTLTEAALQLARTEQGKSAQWRRAQRGRYPGRSTQECFAANVILHAVLAVADEDREAARRLGRRLHREFRLTYGASPPREWHPLLDVAEAETGAVPVERFAAKTPVPAL